MDADEGLWRQRSAAFCWCLVHGLVSLEMAGFHAEPPAADAEHRQYFANFAVGAGDTGVRAQRSVN